jgi:hypothetical protein
MAARHCFNCKRNFPLSIVGTCPACGERQLTYFTSYRPDADWEVAAGRKAEEIPQTAHAAEDNATLVYRNDIDAVMVHRRDLAALGYIPEHWDVVKLNGKYYELCDFDPHSGFWTIERLSFEAWAETALGDLPVADHESPGDTFLDMEVEYDVYQEPDDLAEGA